MFHITDNFKNQTFEAECYKDAANWISSLAWTDYNSETAMEELILRGSVNITHASCNADLDWYWSVNNYRLAFFIEGCDGVGKTTVLDAFDKSTYLHLAEYSSSRCAVDKSEKFKAFGADLSNNMNPLSTAMLTFANRYFNFETVLAHPLMDHRIIISDRSWLTAYAYQGQKDARVREQIWNMGMEFNDWLIANKIIPIYVILSNKPHVKKNDESLDSLSDGAAQYYEELKDRLRSNGILTLRSGSTGAARHISAACRNIAHVDILKEPVVEEPKSLLKRILRK